MLSRITIPRPDFEDVYAVEFLPLPELLGKKFDHIILADISFGKMPKNTMPDPLMNDQARIALNAYLKKPLLRVFFDDPYEPLPVPPRQALEPLWFATSIAAAQKSVHFYCAARDEDGQEQAQSDFFLWLMEHIDSKPHNSLEDQFSSSEENQFLLGIKSRSDVSPLDDRALAIFSRKRSFETKESSRYAFLYDQNKIKASFSGRLDDEPTQALTPSLIEAFATCRFKGFISRILDIKNDMVDADDIEPRILGQIAHGALEHFFIHGDIALARNVINEQVRRLLREISHDFMAHNFVANPTVLWCHLEWLNDALVNLIGRMLNDTSYRDGHVVACEKAFGLGKATWQALAITANERHYLLGGRIDRIDRQGDQFLITDYKLSAVDALKMEIHPNNLLVNTFQMPIYVRLAAKNVASHARQSVSFAYASIRDGELIKLSRDQYPELFDKVFEDKSEHSLPFQIDRIFAPIRGGEVLATAGEHCQFCDFSYVCRKSEGVRRVS